VSDKHQAIMKIEFDVFKLLDTGECSGKTIKQDQLSPFGLKPKVVLGVTEDNLTDLLLRLQRAIKILEKKE
jgi:hypothetical protein